MVKYLNGYISKNILPNETVLCITISEEEGQCLSTVFANIIKEYSRYITCIQLCGCENSMLEIADIFKIAKKSGLHTSWVTTFKDESQVNKILNNELDYLQLNTKYKKKDYSPFGDEILWIDV